ncbi:uncharacterized protein CCOS01_15580, partial [Colletotrichum costaricense]
IALYLPTVICAAFTPLPPSELSVPRCLCACVGRSVVALATILKPLESKTPPRGFPSCRPTRISVRPGPPLSVALHSDQRVVVPRCFGLMI